MNLYQCAGILVDRGLPSVAQLPAPFVEQHVIREAQNARLRVNFDLQALVLQRLLQVVEDLCPGSVSTGQLLGFRLQIRSEEHTSELQSLMRISYAVFCLKKKKIILNYMYN